MKSIKSLWRAHFQRQLVLAGAALISVLLPQASEGAVYVTFDDSPDGFIEATVTGSLIFSSKEDRSPANSGGAISNQGINIAGPEDGVENLTLIDGDVLSSIGPIIPKETLSSTLDMVLSFEFGQLLVPSTKVAPVTPETDPETYEYSVESVFTFPGQSLDEALMGLGDLYSGPIPVFQATDTSGPSGQVIYRALSAVPEPSFALGIPCMIGCGFLIRLRRGA